MPLVKGKSQGAFKSNVRTLMGEIGKSPHVQSREQALAIAYSKKRSGKAGGGEVGGEMFQPQGGDLPIPRKIPPAAISDADVRRFGLSEADLREIGKHVLAHRMWEERVKGATDMVPPTSKFDDSPTPQQIQRSHTDGHYDAQALKKLEGQMEQDANQPPREGPYGVPPQQDISDAPHMAEGGLSTPWTEKAGYRSIVHEGLLHSPTPGRTDVLHIGVPQGAYVVPSSVVSGLGQDNTAAGARVLNGTFSRAANMAKMTMGMRAAHANRKVPGMKPMKGSMRLPFAGGGTVRASMHHVPIVAAGGEYIIHPDIVKKVGQGHVKLPGVKVPLRKGKDDLESGHRTLDDWVVKNRKKHIKILQKLPGPKK